MDEIVRLIQTAEKKTPVKVYVRANRPLHFENCHVFTGADMVVMGDYGDIEPVLARNADAIEDMVIECDRRNSALPLLDVLAWSIPWPSSWRCLRAGRVLGNLRRTARRSSSGISVVSAAGSSLVTFFLPSDSG